MTSVLTLWCTTRQCEVATGILIDAEALIGFAHETASLRCAVCGRQHSIRQAYLKPLPHPFADTAAPPHQARRADAH
ncbi:MAG TPA: hypothetical protein VKF35_01580 [Hyphomicrobiaceae bacterium]|nr:hypothetical protein [Hyphomicrobiaceae bacterium]